MNLKYFKTLPANVQREIIYNDFFSIKHNIAERRIVKTKRSPGRYLSPKA
jgi:hypothetical protein